MKLKCPARMENEDFIVKNIHNHSSARMKAKLIKKEVMNKAHSSSDAEPLRVLSDITAEVQRQDSAVVCSKGSRQGCSSSTVLIDYEKFVKKTDFFNAIVSL